MYKSIEGSQLTGNDKINENLKQDITGETK